MCSELGPLCPGPDRSREEDGPPLAWLGHEGKVEDGDIVKVTSRDERGRELYVFVRLPRPIRAQTSGNQRT